MIAAVILAAGAGTRFGDEPKLLAEFDGRPLLEHTIAAVCAVADLQQIVVVLGANAAGLLAAVDFDHAEPLICEDWREGQSASLKCGLAALDGASKVLVTLGDTPTLNSAVVARMLSHDPPARALYDGRPGHPVVLGPAEMKAVDSLTGDHGARDLLSGAVEVECSDLSSGRDVDTPDDLKAIRDEA